MKVYFLIGEKIAESDKSKSAIQQYFTFLNFIFL